VVAPGSVRFGSVPFAQAPAFFKRKGLYYALFGNCCCFCGHGSGIQVLLRFGARALRAHF
jgi:hypothetical protein